MLFHNDKKSVMPLRALADQQEISSLSRSPTAPPQIRRSSTLSRVKRFGSKLTRTNTSLLLSPKKKAPELQNIFPPSPLPPIITTTTTTTTPTTTETTMSIDEAGPPPCSSSSSCSQTSTDNDDDEVLTTPTSDVAPPIVNNYDHYDNQICVPPSLQQPIALESSPPAKTWALNPTTTMVRSELLRTFEQIDKELEAELDLNRSQMMQSLHNTGHRYFF